MGKFDNVDLGTKKTMERMVQKHKENYPALEWLKDRSNYRVRRTSWPQDMFNVVDHEEFVRIAKFCSAYGIDFKEVEDAG